jgi:hypothetical protein
VSPTHDMLSGGPARSSRAGNILLLVMSLLITFVALEFGYRWYLQRSTLLTYNATSAPLYEYSASVGYGYIANTDAICVFVRNGKLFTYDSVSVGPYGNLGDGVRRWGDDDFKILAFGDSFTANPYKYFSWADNIAEPLEKAIGKNVEVMNLGRDGFGVLSIMRLANATLKTTKADLAVIAFITDDLDRARTWRTKLNVNGRERLLMSVKRSPSPGVLDNSQPTTDIVMVNPAINSAWCKSVLSSETKDDPTLANLREQCQGLVPENFTEGFSTLRTSFLVNRIRYGDPFYTVRKLPPMPRIQFRDYWQDEEFVQDMKELMSQPVPTLIIMLPWYPELKAGKFLLTEERKSLLESLDALTEGNIVRGFDYFDNPQENIEAMFFVPDDQHPKLLGAQRYAQAIVKAIQARWDLKTQPLATPSLRPMKR